MIRVHPRLSAAGFLVLCGCATPRIDPQLSSEIANIKAIDNYAHPVSTDPKDSEYDAMPVETLEPSSDPVRTRPGSPDAIEARKAIKRGDPAQILDQLGIETML